MLTIGLLDGMSWESSAEHDRLANALVRQRLGGPHSARCVLVSVDVANIEPLQVNGAWDEAGARPARAAAQVEAAGADLLLLCTNTMHKVAEHVADAVRIPLLHIVDATAAAVRGPGVRTVGLLGTAFTMEQDFYRDRLASHGLTVIVPEAADWAVVHAVIYDELVVGVVSEAFRKAYAEVIDRLVAVGARGVVLGAPKSNCSSDRTTARCRCSRPPASTSRPPLTSLTEG